MTDTVGVRHDALVVAGLTWRPHGRRLPTLQDVSLSVDPGERVLLVGASGSGKSTLLQAMAGLLDESLGELSGSVAVGGRRPDARPGQVGLLLQDPWHSLVAEYAGRDAAFGPENRGLPRPEVQSRAAAALTEVGFPYGAEHHSTALSGGEMQRLALAGALALGPRVLLLDEPTAMLDPGSAATVRDAVRRTATARGLAVVVVEHRLDGWVDFCDRLVVLGPGGRVLVDGPVREVLTSRRAELLAAGIWVPGAPAPTVEPLRLGAADRSPLRWPGQSVALRSRAVAVGRPGSAITEPPLVRDLDLELPRGTSLAVRGPSGSGKSTLLRAFAGLTPPAAGTIELGTELGLRPAAEVARRSTDLARSVGWLPQQAEQVITRRTVLAEVLATGSALGVTDPAAEQRALRLLEVLGLAHLREADPYEISGGEQRRLALATTLAHAPLLVLLDEPTVGQDRQTWAAVLAVVEEAVRAGSAVVATTHDADFAARLDHTRELTAQPASPAAHAPDHRVRPVLEPGAPPTARANPLALLVVAAGGAVGSVFVSSWSVGALTLLASVLLSPLAVRRVRPTLLRLVPVGIAAVTVGWSTLLFSRYGFFSAQSLPLAAKEILRIGCLVVPGALLVPSLRPSALGDALTARLHLPDRPVVAATSGLLRLESLSGAWRSLVDLRRIRGLAPGRSVPARARHLAAVTLALLVGVLRSAQQMAVSMDARGFAGAGRRTSALGSPWGPRDWLCCLVGLLLLALPVVLSRLG